jgi:hypothetical protein
MSTIPQHVTEMIDALIKAYPTGLPEGIHMNINLNVAANVAETSIPVRHASEAFDLQIETSQPKFPDEAIEFAAEPAKTPAEPPETPAYKGQFLGLYRVVPRLESGRIKIRGSADLSAPEATVSLTDQQFAFLRALNTARPSYLESQGYLIKATDGSQRILYKQFGFDKQLLVISEIKKSEDGLVGRVVGIGNDPYLSDPKPLNTGITNHKTTPWLVHSIESVGVYAPIFASDEKSGWVNMQDVEKVR